MNFLHPVRSSFTPARWKPQVTPRSPDRPTRIQDRNKHCRSATRSSTPDVLPPPIPLMESFREPIRGCRRLDKLMETCVPALLLRNDCLGSPIFEARERCTRGQGRLGVGWTTGVGAAPRQMLEMEHIASGMLYSW